VPMYLVRLRFRNVLQQRVLPSHGDAMN